MPQAVYRALLRLLRLTACYQIQQDAADFFGLLTQNLVDTLPDHVQSLLRQIRPVPLMSFVSFSTSLPTFYIYQHRRKTAKKSSFRLYELLDGADSKI